MNWNQLFIGAGVTTSLVLGGCQAVKDTFGMGDDDDNGAPTGGIYESRIPDQARVVDEGTGRVDWTATADGTVYLFDDTDDNVLYNTQVRDGQRIDFEPANDRVVLDGRDLAELSMADENRYQIYFVSQRDMPQRSPGETREQQTARVPNDAVVVDQARGRDLQFVAQGDGTVYLYDATSNRVVNTFNLDRGQSFSVSPAGDKAAINKEIVLQDMNLNEQNEYRLLFDSD